MIIRKYKPKKAWQKETHKRFAFIPLQDAHKDIFWLESYFVTGDGVRWYMRGRVKEFKTKEAFWKYAHDV